jgi:hypothetical protein
MDWRCGLSSRVPDLQVQSPEYKPWLHREREREREGEERGGEGMEERKERGRREETVAETGLAVTASKY